MLSNNMVISSRKNPMTKKKVKWGEHVLVPYLDNQFGVESDENDLPLGVPRLRWAIMGGPFTAISWSRGFNISGAGNTILTCPAHWWVNV